jgi:proline iminopeptidase
MTATVNDIDLSYSDTGRGIPLLCLHGGMGVDAGVLRVPGILNLADTGVRTIIPDQRGHGRSARCGPRDYSHATWAADAHALAAYLGIGRHALLGHSYGGFLALEYAARWPESVSHLVLVATSAGPVAMPFDEVTSDAEVRERFRAVWGRFFVGADKHWPLFETLHFSADPYNAAFLRELPRYDLRRRAADLEMPTLLIVGSHDAYCGPMRWLAAQLPHATLRVFDGVGHFPFLEAAEDFTATVAAFLNSAGDSAA